MGSISPGNFTCGAGSGGGTVRGVRWRNGVDDREGQSARFRVGKRQVHANAGAVRDLLSHQGLLANGQRAAQTEGVLEQTPRKHVFQHDGVCRQVAPAIGIAPLVVDDDDGSLARPGGSRERHGVGLRQGSAGGDAGHSCHPSRIALPPEPVSVGA